MSLQTAIDAVECLVENYKKLESLNALPQDKIINITFFGGEPMLRYNEVIVPVINYIYEKNYQDLFIFSITTNGTLLNKDIIDFFIDHKTSVMISTDGVKEAQDYNRPFKNSNKSTYDAIYDNLVYLAQRQKHSIFRPTLIPDTVHTLFETYLMGERLGFEQFFSMPNHRQEWPEDKIEILKTELSKICHYILNQFKNGIIPPMRFGPLAAGFTNILYQDIIDPNSITEINHINHCGLGIGTWAIGVNGEIYGCQEQPSKEESNIFYIGDIYNGVDVNKHLKLLELFAFSKKPKCMDEKLCECCPITTPCKMFRLTCPSTMYDLRKDFYHTEKIECIWTQELIKNCLCLMKILTEENNQYFQQFLRERCEYNDILFSENSKQKGGCI